MKLLYFLLLLSHLKNVKSENKPFYPSYTEALSFQTLNLTLKPGLSNSLDTFFDYRDSNYLSTQQNNSEYCLKFILDRGSLSLQHTCQNVCREINFNQFLNTVKFQVPSENTIGPRHCPMGGIISNAVIKTVDESPNGLSTYIQSNHTFFNLVIYF